MGGTYPAWYDPTYWYEGVQVRFDAKRQVRLIVWNTWTYCRMLLSSQAFLIVSLAMLLLVGRKWRAFAQALADRWSLLATVMAGFAIYSLVTTSVEPRYYGAFFSLLWLLLFSSVRLPNTPRVRTSLPYLIAVIVTTLMTLAPSEMPSYRTDAPILSTARSMAGTLVQGETAALHPQWQVAASLSQAGIRPGDQVAVIGDTFRAFWARLARVRIVAEIPSTTLLPKVGGDIQFWTADEAVRSRVFSALAATGAKVVVAHIPVAAFPADAATNGWQRLGGSDHFVYPLVRAEASLRPGGKEGAGVSHFLP